jgi:hypothetical protein
MKSVNNQLSALEYPHCTAHTNQYDWRKSMICLIPLNRTGKLFSNGDTGNNVLNQHKELFAIRFKAFAHCELELLGDFESRHIFGFNRHFFSRSRVSCLTKIFVPYIK